MEIFCEKTQTHRPTDTATFKKYTHPQFKKGLLLMLDNVIVHKDVKMQWNKKSKKLKNAFSNKKSESRAFSLWLHTDFIEEEKGNRMFFVKNEIDKVNKQKGTKDFVVCIEFEPLEPDKQINEGAGKLDLNCLDDPEEFVVLALRMQDGLPIRTRIWKERYYESVFSGYDAVNYLTQQGGAKSVDDALVVMKRMLRQ